MIKPIKIEYISTITNPDHKWYQSKKYISGEALANTLEELIKEKAHQGLRYLDTKHAYVEGSVYQGDGMSHHGHGMPQGLLVFFEEM